MSIKKSQPQSVNCDIECSVISSVKAARIGISFRALKISQPSIVSCDIGRSVTLLAERGGFEPPVRYSRTPAFQASTLDHSDTSPNAPIITKYDSKIISNISLKHKSHLRNLLIFFIPTSKYQKKKPISLYRPLLHSY